MRVLFIASDNNSTSGAFRSMVILNHILKEKYDVYTKVILPKNGDGEKLLQQYDIDYEYARSFSWIINCDKSKINILLQYIFKSSMALYNNTAIKKIENIISSENYDIVHINTSFSYVGALAALKTKTPFIWHIREFLEEDRNLKMLNRSKSYDLMKKANKVIAISKSIYIKYSKLLGDGKTVCIPNGIDTKKYYYQHKIMQNNICEMLIVGSVSPEKGQLELIKALSLLGENYKDFHLNIIGKYDDVAYKKELENLISKSDFNEKIEFLGKRDDAIEFQKKADVIFVCSKAEAFGRVTVEAMLTGALVIGADSAGTAEILDNGKYGVIYKSGNAEDLKKKIEFVMDNKKSMINLAKVGQEYAFQSYTADLNADRIFETYQNVVKERT